MFKNQSFFHLIGTLSSLLFVLFIAFGVELVETLTNLAHETSSNLPFKNQYLIRLNEKKNSILLYMGALLIGNIATGLIWNKKRIRLQINRKYTILYLFIYILIALSLLMTFFILSLEFAKIPIGQG